MNNKCWREIGVWGDLTCPKLETEIHCHNCSVYSQGGRTLLERLEPEGYTAEWTALMALPRNHHANQSSGQQFSDQHHVGTPSETSPQEASQDRLMMTIFRLGQEWLALPANIFDQVVSPNPVHSMPHCHNRLLRGIVNVRGQILPCVSLHALLGIAESVDRRGQPVPMLSSAPQSSTVGPNQLTFKRKPQGNGAQGGYRRLVVIKRSRENWAFEVDELYGLYACVEAALRNAPALTNQALASFTTATFSWKDQNVSYLAADQLFSVLRQRAL
ncbi:MAG: chemotaxis protein CheW [Cyanobacteria bacterium P01_F01_bin.53]